MLTPPLSLGTMVSSSLFLRPWLLMTAVGDTVWKVDLRPSGRLSGILQSRLIRLRMLWGCDSKLDKARFALNGHALWDKVGDRYYKASIFAAQESKLWLRAVSLRN